MPTNFRHSPRLKNFDYIGPLAGHLTIVTRGRSPLFERHDLASLCVEALNESALAVGIELVAYSVTPDHVHLLVGVPDAVSLQRFAKQFKQLAGFRIKAVCGRPVWQVSYYDHLLRREESAVDVAAYIWENPVRKGLVVKREDYPFSGPRELFSQA